MRQTDHRVMDFLIQHCYLEPETKQIFELNQMSKSKYGNSCNTSEGIKPKNVVLVSVISPLSRTSRHTCAYKGNSLNFGDFFSRVRDRS